MGFDSQEPELATAPSGDDDLLRWQEGAEVGGVQADGVDNSTGNDDWGQSSSTQASESFSSSFGSTPEIGSSKDADRDSMSANQYHHEITNKSTTGFDVNFQQMSADDNSGVSNAYALSYVATEGR